MTELIRGLTENRVETDPSSTDDRLRGRTYAIPFEAVWQAATGLCAGGIRGWSLWVADDQEGVIEASVSRLIGPAVDVRVKIGLDQNAQTRVDLTSASRTERGDLGRGRRLVGRFIHRLDTELRAGPGKILDASRTAAWHDPS